MGVVDLSNDPLWLFEHPDQRLDWALAWRRDMTQMRRDIEAAGFGEREWSTWLQSDEFPFTLAETWEAMRKACQDAWRAYDLATGVVRARGRPPRRAA